MGLGKKITILGLIVGAILFVLSVNGTSFAGVVDTLESANPWYLVPFAGLFLVNVTMRALRWSRIIEPVKKMALYPVFSTLMIGYMGNNLLPARMGEVLRVYLLGRQEDASKSSIAATIVLERAVDALSLLLVLVVLLLLMPTPDWVKSLAVLGGAIILAAAGALGLLAVRNPILMRVMRQILGWLPARVGRRLDVFLDRFILGLQVARDGRGALLIALYSLGLWLVDIVSVYLVARSLNIDLPFIGAALVLVVVNFGTMIPSAPAFIGTFEFLSVSTAALFGVDRTSALTFSLCMHALYFALSVGIGGLCLVASGLSLSTMRRVLWPSAEKA